MKLYIASDHAGFELKAFLIEKLSAENIDIEDKGPFEYNPDDDYPEFIALVAEEVALSQQQSTPSFGIIIGASGQGEAMVANRFDEVRAAVYYGHDLEIVRLSREHNNANILSLGAKFLTHDYAYEAVNLWMRTPFSDEPRHERRNEEIDDVN